MDVVENSEKVADKPPVDPAVASAVKEWTDKIGAARKHWEKTFKRIGECQQLARDGADKTWVEAEKFVVPIINRHINQAVSQLYAKNPKSYSKRKKRRMFTIWDGTATQLQEAQMSVQAAAQMTAGAEQAGMVAAPPPVDPMAEGILQDALAVKQYDTLMDGIADTMTLLQNHYMDDKAAQYKQQFKALVRRTKVCCVGYVKLGFQRMLAPNPDDTAKAADITRQLAVLDRLQKKQTAGEMENDSADVEKLRTMLADVQSQPKVIVQEGPVLTFTKSRQVIIDMECTHLKTLTGADWWAEELDLTPERVQEIYGVDLKDGYKKYEPEIKKDAEVKQRTKARVWIVQCRSTGQEFTLCDGYDDWLKPPTLPEVKLTRFFTIFPLVFNETEDDDNIFPPSDVWQARHIQKEYNRKRDALRNHRIGARPAMVGALGNWDDADAKKFQDHEDNELILVKGLQTGEKISDKLFAKPTITIDPALYDVEGDYADLQRTVGSQQANLGGTSGDTATETSIAEQSRTVALSDNIDDLDDLLSLLAHSMGELMLRELSTETVKTIVGPGAVWPEDPETREEIIEDIILDIRAGSAGRPNQAAEVAKMERAMPTMLQLPGLNPTPVAEKYLDLMEIDLEGAIVEGLPSIVAQNQLAGRPSVQPGTGDPATDPGAQGDKGGDNAEQPDENESQGQPEMPTSVTHYDHTGARAQ